MTKREFNVMLYIHLGSFSRESMRHSDGESATMSVMFKKGVTSLISSISISEISNYVTIYFIHGALLTVFM